MVINPYGTGKALYHREHVEKLQRGELVAPVHVQLIVSDFCNQDCSFCCDGKSVLLLAKNNRPVYLEDVNVGDWVQGPSGENLVVETSERYVNEVFEVSVGDRVLIATGNHEILTDKGMDEN